MGVEPQVNCPECGAVDNACEARFHEFLILEFENPGYGAVHHLTVAAYMVQHSSNLTKEGWLFERGLLHEFLVEKKPPSFIRKQNKDVVDSGKRTFKIKDENGLPKIGKTQWAKTILNVHVEDAEIYCVDVKAWAASVLDDAKNLEL